MPHVVALRRLGTARPRPASSPPGGDRLAPPDRRSLPYGQRSIQGGAILAFASPALVNHPGLVEAALAQVLVADPEIEPAGVAPHHLGRVVAVELQEQPPVVLGRVQLLES